MNFITRSINLLTQPKAELQRAAAEPATVSGLILGYGVLLAALPAIGGLLGSLIFAGAYIGDWIVREIIDAVLIFLLRDLGLTILIGIIAAALAPNLGGQRNQLGGIKLAIYAATPIWLMGFVGGLLVYVVPELYYLLLIIGFGYAALLIYLGCRPLLAIPDAQAPAMAGILTVIWLVLYFLVGAILSRIIHGGTYYYRR